MKKLRHTIPAFTIAAVGAGLTLFYSNCSRVAFEPTAPQTVQSLGEDTPREPASEPPAIPVLVHAAGSIQINQNASFTNLLEVKLSISSDDATEMYITNKPGCESGGEWEPLGQLKIWQLEQKNQETRVYAKFRSSSDGAAGDCINDAIIHDDIAPMVVVPHDLPSLSKSNEQSFSFMAIDNLSGIERLDCSSNPEWTTACQANAKFHTLGEGTHAVRIEAIDKAGNKSEPKVSTILVDLTAPVVTLAQMPPLLSGSATAMFAFSAIDTISGVASLECQINGGAWATCASPVSFQLSAGVQNFALRGIDKAGNISVPLTHNWTIDLTAPNVQITSSPGPITNQVNAVFSFTGDDDGVPITRFQCSLDKAEFTDCTSPQSYSGLPEGTHEFQVRGYDQVGNLSQPATYSWMIDTTKPSVLITSHPSSLTKETVATFGFQGQDHGSGIREYQCRMNAGSFSTCSAPQTYTELVDGGHTFGVKAIDAAGNESEIVLYNWQIDLTKPTVRITSAPATQTKDLSATFMFTASDTGGGKIASIQCLIDDAQQFAACNSPLELSGLSQGSHVFQVRAIDTVGWISDIVTHTWFVDDKAPIITFGQTPPAQSLPGGTLGIQYTATDSGVGEISVQCGLNGSLANCPDSQQISLTGLGVGSHTFTVIATDSLGNSSTAEILFAVQPMTYGHTQTLVSTANRKVDVLVIIDNSGSMSTEQSNMASRFSSFLDKLNGLDWHVAITTTDMVSTTLGDGKLLSMGTLGAFISSSMNSAAARTAFANTIQRPERGNGNEQGLAATHRFVQRYLDSAAANNNHRTFLRSDAALAVLVVTDADETPPSTPWVRNTPQGVKDYISASLPGKTFTYHSIIVKPGDANCKAQAGNEGYGYAYTSMSQMTGGLIGTVCSTDYGAQLSAMGQATENLVRSATLECLPIDTSGDGVADVQVGTADGSPAPAFTISGNLITFASPLPIGENTLNYSCVGQ